MMPNEKGSFCNQDGVTRQPDWLQVCSQSKEILQLDFKKEFYLSWDNSSRLGENRVGEIKLIHYKINFIHLKILINLLFIILTNFVYTVLKPVNQKNLHNYNLSIKKLGLKSVH